MDDHGELVARVATIVALGVILLAAVIGLTFVAVLTDRDVFRAEALTFAGVMVLAALGGVSWWALRRPRWRIRVDHESSEEADRGT
jgi:hypothetical protein